MRDISPRRGKNTITYSILTRAIHTPDPGPTSLEDGVGLFERPPSSRSTLPIMDSTGEEEFVLFYTPECHKV
jgi:hypothetical protein